MASEKIRKDYEDRRHKLQSLEAEEAKLKRVIEERESDVSRLQSDLQKIKEVGEEAERHFTLEFHEM